MDGQIGSSISREIMVADIFRRRDVDYLLFGSSYYLFREVQQDLTPEI